ncbi:response regulator transcription factor [Geodermatophilus sp. YIM 151500]|uniref:response regulator transcription factor n=1 Tax=Geodermatophilus sp. YIM 151500 TaxID=2984531 RepID=UPI0021E4777E|nr:response regulator transcription factor [Geodermatophilus sp. YIM 151500]MCV2491795.1 response regulator transcription factor [Geodermatophilus sp. YIM 151500]
MRVLVVEDQPKMQDLLCRGLQQGGYAVDTAADGPSALHQATESAYDAILLDVMLPGLDGFEVLRRLRAAERWTPVLMLTARDAVQDRVRGLDGGADDYIVKPFAFSELLSRLRAVIRRGRPARPVVLRCGPLELDPATRTTTVRGTEVALSPREFALLEMLLDRDGAVVTRTELLDHVWDSSYDGVSNVVDVYVRNLRDKIDRRFGVRLIHTVRGAGYRIAEAA